MHSTHQISLTSGGLESGMNSARFCASPVYTVIFFSPMVTSSASVGGAKRNDGGRYCVGTKWVRVYIQLCSLRAEVGCERVSEREEFAKP